MDVEHSSMNLLRTEVCQYTTLPSMIPIKFQPNRKQTYPFITKLLIRSEPQFWLCAETRNMFGWNDSDLNVIRIIMDTMSIKIDGYWMWCAMAQIFKWNHFVFAPNAVFHQRCLWSLAHFIWNIANCRTRRMKEHLDLIICRDAH